MRQWQARPANRAGETLGALVRALGDPQFQAAMLDELQPITPAASWSVYRTGRHCRPTLFLSASRGVPDRTRECWRAYLSGPYLYDRSFGPAEPMAPKAPRLCHVLAGEIPPEHRVRVYEAHGIVERISVVDCEDDAVFAVNFYRHSHQAPFTDAQIDAFESIAVPVLELVRKHIAFAPEERRGVAPARHPISHELMAARLPPVRLREQLLELSGDLTVRELDVCTRLLQGMTQDGIAAELGLSLATIKTYRNRAFARLGIHFRNELFARVLRCVHVEAVSQP